ncbi:MAG: hypothetical protein ACKVH8_01320 [Pirellulales bacterium]
MKPTNLLSLGCLVLMLVGCKFEVDGSSSTSSPPGSADLNLKEIKPESVTSESTQKISTLLQNRANILKTTDGEIQQIEDHLKLLLPSQEYIGDENEWELISHGFLISLRLINKETKRRQMWFHILYKKEKDPAYGVEDFLDNYRGMGSNDVHYFILAGRVEIRAVAVSDEYKDDAKIKGILAAFNLKEIEKL